jgi:hypothetical protein
MEHNLGSSSLSIWSQQEKTKINQGSSQRRGALSLSVGVEDCRYDIIDDGTAISSTKRQLRGSLENVQTCPLEVFIGL